MRTDHCGQIKDKPISTGQGNKFSNNMCRDVSALIVKQLKMRI